VCPAGTADQGDVRARCSRRAPWSGVGSFGAMRVPAQWAAVDQRPLMGSGGAGMSRVGPLGSLGRGGGKAAIGAVDQPPAALVHGPMMSPAHQGQIGQAGGAAIQPVDQMVGLAPGQGTGTAGEDAAAVADGQGGALGGLDGPAAPPDASSPTPPGWPSRLSRSTVTVSWGRTPPTFGSRPPSKVRRASSVRASAVRWRPLRGSLRRRGGPGVPGPPAGCGRPRPPGVRRWRPCLPRSGQPHPRR